MRRIDIIMGSFARVIGRIAFWLITAIIITGLTGTFVWLIKFVIRTMEG